MTKITTTERPATSEDDLRLRLRTAKMLLKTAWDCVFHPDRIEWKADE